MSWLQARLWRSAAAFLLGIAGTVTAVRLPQQTVPVSPENPDGDTLTGWAVALLLVSIVLLALGLLSAEAWRQARYWKDADRRAERVRKLSSSLQEALADINAIQREVEQGSALLARLEEDATTKAHLAALSEAESEAVRDLLARAVRKETNRGTWLATGIAAVVFLLGLVASHYI